MMSDDQKMRKMVKHFHLTDPDPTVRHGTFSLLMIIRILFALFELVLKMNARIKYLDTENETDEDHG